MKKLFLALVAFLMTVPLTAQDEKSFQPFATVTVGTYVSVDDYIRDIRRSGMGIFGRTVILLRGVNVEKGTWEQALTMVTPRDLGFPNGALVDRLYARALEHGLGLCSVETALALRLAYRSQSDDDQLWVASQPIMATDPFDGRELPGILGLKSDYSGYLWLNSSNLYGYIKEDVKLVFLLSERTSYRPLRSPDKLEFRPTQAVTLGAWGLGIHTTFGAPGREDAYTSWLGVGTHLFRSRDDRLLAGGVGLNLMGIVSRNTEADETFGLGLQIMPLSISVKGKWLYVTPTYTRFLIGHPRSRNAFGINFTMLADFDWN